MLNTQHLYDASFYVSKNDTIHKLIVADNIFAATEVVYALARENEDLHYCTAIAEMEEVHTLTACTLKDPNKP